MSDPQDLATEVAQLHERLTAVRKQRMAAQKNAVSKPVLELALERVSRNRSSGATDEIDELLEELNRFRSEIMVEIHSIDRTRSLVEKLSAELPGLEGLDRMFAVLNLETAWRNELIDNDDISRVHLSFPRNQEVN